MEWLHKLLQHDLKMLRLNETIITDRELALDMLIQKYRYNKAIRLYGQLIAGQSMTREQMIARGASASTLRRTESTIQQAGVALAMTDKVALTCPHS
jgi:hypothetical protein